LVLECTFSPQTNIPSSSSTNQPSSSTTNQPSHDETMRRFENYKGEKIEKRKRNEREMIEILLK